MVQAGNEGLQCENEIGLDPLDWDKSGKVVDTVKGDDAVQHGWQQINCVSGFSEAIALL